MADQKRTKALMDRIDRHVAGIPPDGDTTYAELILRLERDRIAAYLDRIAITYYEADLNVVARRALKMVAADIRSDKHWETHE